MQFPGNWLKSQQEKSSNWSKVRMTGVVSDWLTDPVPDWLYEGNETELVPFKFFKSMTFQNLSQFLHNAAPTFENIQN